jgi:eukaryotic-like serine/threonine-protein kinase
MSETVIAGRYRLDQLLGRSGMSEVWQATDVELDRRVALKLLAPNADTARFEREARAVAALAHPNVTRLYDYGEADGRPFMVLEYLPGGTLEERLRERSPLPDEETHEIAAEIAAGLAHAHSRGVVHRDLKPSNVLFDEEGRAKLADFGIARFATGEGTLTDAGTVLGTAAYISPEQAAGQAAIPASDVYSFGVIVHRMLTARLPFESDDPLELVMLHRDQEALPVSAVRGDAPPLLAAATDAALAKDPRQRPQDGAALLATLGVQNANGTTNGTLAATGSTRVMPAMPPPVPPRRSRVPLAVMAVVFLALAGAALAWAVTRPAHGSTPGTVTFPATQTTRHNRTQPTTTATTTSTTTTAASTTQSTTRAIVTHPTTTQSTATHAATTFATPPTTTAPTTTTASATTASATTTPTTTTPATTSTGP